ncbi:MAG TPA: hypothetical protein VFT22_21520, partial [Kofleriaceae bacterium]|nr:hypothetical protein [Kofleriaceae bacterium]
EAVPRERTPAPRASERSAVPDRVASERTPVRVHVPPSERTPAPARAPSSERTPTPERIAPRALDRAQPDPGPGAERARREPSAPHGPGDADVDALTRAKPKP